MEKTKINVLITALTILAATLISVTYAQNTNNQNLGTNGYQSPAPQANGTAGSCDKTHGYPASQTYNNGHHSCPRNSYAKGTPQNLSPYQPITGTSGCHR